MVERAKLVNNSYVHKFFFVYQPYEETNYNKLHLIVIRPYQ